MRRLRARGLRTAPSSSCCCVWEASRPEGNSEPSISCISPRIADSSELLPHPTGPTIIHSCPSGTRRVRVGREHCEAVRRGGGVERERERGDRGDERHLDFVRSAIALAIVSTVCAATTASVQALFAVHLFSRLPLCGPLCPLCNPCCFPRFLLLNLILPPHLHLPIQTRRSH